MKEFRLIAIYWHNESNTWDDQIVQAYTLEEAKMKLINSIHKNYGVPKESIVVNEAQFVS